MSQCETTQVRDQDKGAALFGYTKLYGQVPGGQAEYLRVPQAHFGPVAVPDGPPTSGTCTSPTSCPRRGRRSSTPMSPGGTVVVVGLGPIGQMAGRVAPHRGAGRVIGWTWCRTGWSAQGHGIEVST